MARFDHQPTLNPEPIITKFETRDYVGDIFFQKFFGSIRTGDFVPPYTRNIHSKPSNVYYTFSVLPSFNREGLVLIFALNTSYDVVLRMEVPFGGEKN